MSSFEVLKEMAEVSTTAPDEATVLAWMEAHRRELNEALRTDSMQKGLACILPNALAHRATVLKLLNTLGAPMQESDRDNDTALSYALCGACKNEQDLIDTVKFLCEMGLADGFHTTALDPPPLAVALRHPCALQLVECLENAGHTLLSPDSEFGSVLSWLLHRNKVEDIEKLLAWGKISENELQLAISDMDLEETDEAVQALIAHIQARHIERQTRPALATSVRGVRL